MTDNEERPSGPELLTIPATARRAGIGVRQLDRALAAGELTMFAIGGWRRLRWNEVLAWIERHRQGDAET